LPTSTELQEDAATGFEARYAQASAAARHERIPQHDDQPILSIRDSVPEAEAEKFIADALHDIRVFMQEHDLRPAGPPFSLCRARGGNLDIEAGWPTAGQPHVGTSRVHGGSLPRSLTGALDRFPGSTGARDPAPAG
jgi:hypothetical protein